MINLVNDIFSQGNKTIEITLSNPTIGTLDPNEVHTFRIAKDDSATLTIADVSVNENSGIATVTLTLDNEDSRWT